MIARELELNNWAIKSIRHTFLEVERYLEHAPKPRMTVFFSKAGEILFRGEDAEGNCIAVMLLAMDKPVGTEECQS